MIESIGGSSSIQYQQTNYDRTLTDDQKDLLNEIIAKYDPENMTGEDGKAMMDEIKEAGIPRSKDVKEALDAAGFKPPEKPEGGPQGKPPVEGKELPQELLDLIEQKESGEISEDEFFKILEEARENNGSSQGVYIDEKV